MVRKGRRGSIKQEKPLKAIVFGDSFTKEFRPITLEKPRILFPVVNVPLIDYVLELLVQSEVKEIYIFCQENADLIQDYISQSKWVLEDVVIQTKIVKGAESVGDFVRNLENFGVSIETDFIIIQGDVVSNINLKPIIKKHKTLKRRLMQESGSILLMTSIFVEESSFSKTPKLVENDKNSVCIAFGKRKSKVVSGKGGRKPNQNSSSSFEKCELNELISYKSQMKELFELKISEFDQFKDIEVCSNVTDAHIDICTPDVLEVFKENFDFKDMREDLLKGVLTNQVISSGNSIHPHIVRGGGYSRRVNSLRAYEQICNDITKRWLYPLAPDSNFTGKTYYTLNRGNNYFENNEKISKLAKLVTDNVIGYGTSIGEHSIIDHCIIGRNVKIGKNVHIEDSFIWEGAVIHDGAVISKSLIMDCEIGEKAVVKRGSVICSGVIIGENHVVRSFSKLTVRKDDSGDDSPHHLNHSSNHSDDLRVESLQTDIIEVGEGGRGRKYEGNINQKEFNVLGCANDEIWPKKKKSCNLKRRKSGKTATKGMKSKDDDDEEEEGEESFLINDDELEDDEEVRDGELIGCEEEFLNVNQRGENAYESLLIEEEYFENEQDEKRQFSKEQKDKMEFREEVKEIVTKSIENQSTSEEVFFDVKSRQLAYDRPTCETSINILHSLMFFSYKQFQKMDCEEKEKRTWLNCFVELFDPSNQGILNWKGFIHHFSRNEKNLEMEIMDSLLDLLESKEGNIFNGYMELIMNTFHDLDLLTDKIIIQWFEEVMNSDKSSESDKTLAGKCSKFVEWLKSEEGDGESEEEEDILAPQSMLSGNNKDDDEDDSGSDESDLGDEESDLENEESDLEDEDDNEESDLESEED